MPPISPPQASRPGLTLEVTPSVCSNGLVALKVKQTSEASGTTRAEAEASVLVHDHDTVLLGGLSETNKTWRDTRTESVVLLRTTVLPASGAAALRSAHN